MDDEDFISSSLSRTSPFVDSEQTASTDDVSFAPAPASLAKVEFDDQEHQEGAAVVNRGSSSSDTSRPLNMEEHLMSKEELFLKKQEKIRTIIQLHGSLRDLVMRLDIVKGDNEILERQVAELRAALEATAAQ